MKLIKVLNKKFNTEFLWTDKDLLVAVLFGVAFGIVVGLVLGADLFSHPMQTTWRPLVG